jgi:hypothetical protein
LAFIEQGGSAMRFTKTDILAAFDREDKLYRLGLLCSHWLRGGKHYSPSAIYEADGMQMEARGVWVSFADLASDLKSDPTIISSDFMLNQLHALIRAPFELLSDYCEDYDQEYPEIRLHALLKQASWFEFARLVRNAISHNFRFEFGKYDRSILPVRWNSLELTVDLDGHEMSYEQLWHRTGYELFLEMGDFARSIPAN